MATLHISRSTNSKRPLLANARSSKLASLSKRTNSNGGRRKSAHQKCDDSDDERVMATSFLQYCTTCEKQIVVPSNFILYCSESCRKKDDSKQMPTPPNHSPPYMSPMSNLSLEDLHFQDIVPARSPTAPSKRSSCNLSEVSSDDNAASGDERLRMESEAARYLRQFQSATETTETGTLRPVRPRYGRASTSLATFSAAPSLSHTPASSLSFSLPYTPSTRPLPPRIKPSSSYVAKSAELVTPFAYAHTAPSTPPQYSMKSGASSGTYRGTVEGELSYEKSPIPSMANANGSLKQLFEGSPARWA